MLLSCILYTVLLSTAKQQSHPSPSLLEAPPLKRRIRHIISLPSLMVPPTLIAHNARSIQMLYKHFYHRFCTHGDQERYLFLDMEIIYRLTNSSNFHYHRVHVWCIYIYMICALYLSTFGSFLWQMWVNCTTVPCILFDWMIPKSGTSNSQSLRVFSGSIGSHGEHRQTTAGPRENDRRTIQPL